MRRLSSVRLAAAIAVLAVVGAACAQSDDSGEPADGAADVAAPATLTVTTTDDGNGGGYGFSVDETVDAGPTRISVKNDGKEVHHVQLFKLNGDATVEQLGQALQTESFEDDAAVGTYDGGTGQVAPGQVSKADAIADLQAGTYVLLCFVPTQGNGPPHVAGGMMQPFEVTASEDTPEPPAADATITFVDYGYDGVPADIAGDATIEFTNGGNEPHEMNIFKLNEGVTSEAFVDALKKAQGPPPGLPVGGMQGILPGAKQSMQIELEPGEYVFLCFIPDAEGTPHMFQGMARQATVS